MNSMGSRLKWARKQAKISQEDLALRSGVTQGLVSKIERGDQDGTSVVAEFAFHCGINARWLATGKGDPAINSSEIGVSLSNVEKEIVGILRGIDNSKKNSLLAFAKHLEAESYKESLDVDSVDTDKGAQSRRL